MTELAKEVFDVLRDEADLDEDYYDAFILMGYLVKEELCRLDMDNPILPILQEFFESSHELWDYIAIEE